MKHVLNNLLWIEDLLPPDVEIVPKHGGMAYYLDMKLVLILVENRDGETEHKGVTYPFELWYGCILPIEQIKQSAFFLKYSFLENHPANKHWLYIPADTENFEDEVKQYMREIVKRNPLLGIPVKMSGPRKEKSAEEKSDKKPAKKTPKKEKTDKKTENAFLMSMLGKRIK